MRFTLDIDYPVDEIEKSRQRMQARYEFRSSDRVPVLCNFGRSTFMTVFGIDFKEFHKDAETQYYWWLQFAKYRIENIPEDYCTSTTISIAPNFENARDSHAFGGEVAWLDNIPARVIPTLKNVEDIERFEIPEPDAGLWGTALEWWAEMTDLARETKVTIGGQEGRIDIAPLAMNGLGPFSIAVDLVGEDFFWWLMEFPQACHKLLDKIAKGMLGAEANFQKVDPRPRTEYQISEDSAQLASSGIFQKFCVPYVTQLYALGGHGLSDGRGMHLCGNSTHLHESLLNDLHVTHLKNFGYEVEPEDAAANLGGKVYLLGNVDPMLMLNGPKEEIKQVAKERIEVLGPLGGYVLSDGGAVCLGTPVEHVGALVEAAEEYGPLEVLPRVS
jgi:hypothetical protein